MSEDFSRAVLGQSIARVCVAFGLKETSAPCIQSLTDVVQYYIQWVGEGAVEQAEMSGRAHPGIQDALQALGNNQYRSLRDFAFSDIKNPELNPRWSQPFHHDVPEFPVKRKSKRIHDMMLKDTNVRGQNVPEHLPTFPPRHTYSKKIKKSKTSEQRDITLKTISASRSIQNTLAKIENAEDK